MKLYNDLYMFTMAVPATVPGLGDRSCLSPTEMPRKTVVCVARIKLIDSQALAALS